MVVYLLTETSEFDGPEHLGVFESLDDAKAIYKSWKESVSFPGKLWIGLGARNLYIEAIEYTPA